MPQRGADTFLDELALAAGLGVATVNDPHIAAINGLKRRTAHALSSSNSRGDGPNRQPSKMVATSEMRRTSETRRSWRRRMVHTFGSDTRSIEHGISGRARLLTRSRDGIVRTSDTHIIM